MKMWFWMCPNGPVMGPYAKKMAAKLAAIQWALAVEEGSGLVSVDVEVFSDDAPDNSAIFTLDCGIVEPEVKV